MARRKKTNPMVVVAVMSGVIGGALAYLGRGELERLINALKPGTTTAARARMLYR